MRSARRPAGNLLVAISALVCGAGAGWTFYGQVVKGSLTDAVSAPATQEPALSLRHASVDLDAARAVFETLRWGEVPAAPPPMEAPPPPPPPPDVAVLLRQDITAIEQTPRGPLLWVVDHGQVRSRRAIPVGGEYRDGWRVVSVSPQAVEIRRRREVRRVSPFDPVAP